MLRTTPRPCEVLDNTDDAGNDDDENENDEKKSDSKRQKRKGISPLKPVKIEDEGMGISI